MESKALVYIHVLTTDDCCQPSFFISFLGRDSLPAALVDDTCQSDSVVDMATKTIRVEVYIHVHARVCTHVPFTHTHVLLFIFLHFLLLLLFQVCSTVLPGQDPATLSHPVSLSCRRRQTNSTSNTTNTDTNTTATPTSLSYLDRLVHFIVMEVGNLSLNTATSLSFPGLETQESSLLSSLFSSS